MVIKYPRMPLTVNTSSGVKTVFERYSPEVREKLEHLRMLIIETAGSISSIDQVEETLKWGEPSYLVKGGSTIRIDWKARNPAQYAMYFKCTSRLVPTFRDHFGDVFTFEGDRAIVFEMNAELPEAELALCIRAALRYHAVKKLPELGLADT